MAEAPSNLTLRREFEDNDFRDPKPPLLRQVSQGTSETPEPRTIPDVRENAPSENLPVIKPPPPHAGGIFEQFSRGIRSFKLNEAAAKEANKARRAELRGDMELKQQYLENAAALLRQAENEGPDVKSVTEVDSLPDALKFGLGLAGESGPSLLLSIGGGTGGRVATSLGRRAIPGLTKTLSGSKKAADVIDTAGAFAGAGASMYPVVKGGVILAQEMDPVIAAKPVEERERYATGTALASSGLEALVPSLIGSRVGQRILARGKVPGVTGRVTNRGKLLENMIGEGLTEVSQTELEQFALSLQNPDQPRMAELEDLVNAFLGGVTGGAQGHAIGRTLEFGVDQLARIRPGPKGQFGVLGNIRMTASEQLDDILRDDKATRRTMLVVDLAERKAQQAINELETHSVLTEGRRATAEEQNSALNQAFHDLSQGDKRLVRRAQLLREWRTLVGQTMDDVPGFESQLHKAHEQLLQQRAFQEDPTLEARLSDPKTRQGAQSALLDTINQLRQTNPLPNAGRVFDRMTKERLRETRKELRLFYSDKQLKIIEAKFAQRLDQDERVFINEEKELLVNTDDKFVDTQEGQEAQQNEPEEGVTSKPMFDEEIDPTGDFRDPRTIGFNIVEFDDPAFHRGRSNVSSDDFRYVGIRSDPRLRNEANVAESRTALTAAYKPNGTSSIDPGFELRALLRNIQESPYSSDFDESRQEVRNYNSERVNAVSYKTFLDAHNAVVDGVSDEKNYVFAAIKQIKDLQFRIKRNRQTTIERRNPETGEVIEEKRQLTPEENATIQQHLQQIAELQEALQQVWTLRATGEEQINVAELTSPELIENFDTSQEAAQLLQGVEFTNTEALQQLFDEKYFLGAIRKQETSGLGGEFRGRATDSMLQKMQRGFQTARVSENARKDSEERRMHFVRSIPEAERIERGLGNTTEIISTDPESMLSTALQFASLQDRTGRKDKKRVPLIHEAAAAVLARPDILGVAETDENNQPITKNGEFIYTDRIKSRPISSQHLYGYYQDAISAREYWKDRLEKMDPNERREAFELHLKDLNRVAELAGIPELINTVQRETAKFREGLGTEKVGVDLRPTFRSIELRILEEVDDAMNRLSTLERQRPGLNIHEIVELLPDSKLAKSIRQLQVAAYEFAQTSVDLHPAAAGTELRGQPVAFDAAKELREEPARHAKQRSKMMGFGTGSAISVITNVNSYVRDIGAEERVYYEKSEIDPPENISYTQQVTDARGGVKREAERLRSEIDGLNAQIQNILRFNFFDNAKPNRDRILEIDKRILDLKTSRGVIERRIDILHGIETRYDRAKKARLDAALRGETPQARAEIEQAQANLVPIAKEIRNLTAERDRLFKLAFNSVEDTVGKERLAQLFLNREEVIGKLEKLTLGALQPEANAPTLVPDVPRRTPALPELAQRPLPTDKNAELDEEKASRRRLENEINQLRRRVEQNTRKDGQPKKGHAQSNIGLETRIDELTAQLHATIDRIGELQEQAITRHEEQIHIMLKATRNAINLAKKIKDGDTKPSKFELTAAKMAFALVSDQKGQQSVNVGNILDMQPNHVVFMVLNSLNKATTLKHIKNVARAGGNIVLSSASQVTPEQMTEHLSNLGYAQHPVEPNLFVNVYQRENYRREITHATNFTNYEVQREQLTQDIMEGKFVDDDSLFIQYLLWELNYWHNGPSRGERKFEVSKEDRKRLAEAGYQLTWQEGILQTARLRSVSKTKKKSKTSRKTDTKTQPTATQDKEVARAKHEAAREENTIRARKLIADRIKRERLNAQAAFANAANFRSRNARHNFAEMLRSFGLSAEEQRMRKKLQSSIVDNLRVRKQVMATLEENPYGLTRQEIKALESDPELFVGYTFQLWLDNKVHIGPAPEEHFRRIIEFFLGLIGIHLSHYYGEEILFGFAMEQLKDRHDIKQLFTNLDSGTMHVLSNVNREVQKGIDKLIRAAPDVIRNLNVPEARQLAARLEQFVDDRRVANSIWKNRLTDSILKPFSEAEIEEGWQEYRVGEPQTAAAKAIEQYVNDVYQFLEESGAKVLDRSGEGKLVSVPPSTRNWKVPAAFDVQKLERNRTQFHQLLVQEGMDAGEANTLIDSIFWANGHYALSDTQFDIDNSPHSVSAFSGMLQIINKNNAKNFAQYFTDNAPAALFKFTQQAVHKSAFSQHFKHDGRVITETLTTFNALDLPHDQLKYIRNRVIPAMLGTLSFNMHPKWRRATATVITIQNMAILPLMLFASFVDIWGVSINSGDMMDGWRAAKRGMREIKNSLSHEPDGMETLARIMGVIDEHSLLDRIGDTYNELMDQSVLRKMNQTFFKLTMIEQWTKGVRIAALESGLRYIADHHNNAEKLAPLGLEVGDVKLSQNGELENLVDDPKLVRALNKWVDSSILRPSAAHRPAWGSDPRFLIFWHLKQFTFSFHRVYTERVIREIHSTNPNYMILLPFIMMVPTMMFSDMLRNIVAPSPFYDQMSFGDHLGRAVQRSSVLGIYTFGLDAMADTNFGKFPGFSLLGPTVESSYRFVDRGLGEGLWRITPGYALWNKWANP